MKTLKITLLLCFFVLFANAQNIITIDNSPQSTTTHQTLQDALDAAVSGDFIYIQPTATSYGNGVIDKPVTIVGRSHSETIRESKAGSIVVRSSNVIIKGINFSSLSTSSAGTTPGPYTGLRVFECEVSIIALGSSSSTTATVYIDDVEIQGCVFSSFTQNTDAQNILISNNIIKGSIVERAPITVIIANNIFRRGSFGNFSLQNTSTTATAIYYNNIFSANSGSNVTITLNSGDFNFSNCLTYNHGTGDLAFDLAAGASYLDNNTLVSTSTNNGSVFNSGFNYDYIGNPRDIPTLDIINYDAAVPKNGTINVTVKAKAH